MELPDDHPLVVAFNDAMRRINNLEQQALANPAGRKGGRLRPFYGINKGEPWPSWRAHVEMTARFHNWRMIDAVSMTLGALVGDAQMLRKGIPQATYDACQSLEALLDLLEARFQPAKERQCLMSAFDRATQLPNEGLVQLAGRLAAMYQSAHPREEDRNEATLVRRYIAAIKDREIARQVDMKEPTTLHDASDIALKISTWYDLEASSGGSGFVPESVRPFMLSGYEGNVGQGAAVYPYAGVNALQVQAANTATALKAVKRGGATTAGRGRGVAALGRGTPNPGPHCFACGSVSHFIRNCPERTKATGTAPAAPRRGQPARPTPGNRAAQLRRRHLHLAALDDETLLASTEEAGDTLAALQAGDHYEDTAPGNHASGEEPDYTYLETWDEEEDF